jgi:L-gulono-1,4-lactone dehydrogenase
VPQFVNFGRNQVFEPKAVHAPSSEEELLQILDANRGRRFRVMGRLHSWSPAAVADDVLLDLRRLRQVTVRENGDAPFTEIGAGCQIKEVLEELSKQGYTLCSLGLITEQSIAGAVSTSTHGSGRHSTSHYVLGVRLAHFDPQSGKATIREISEGDELRAARCSLGSLGVITSVRVAIRKQYMIEEHFRRYANLEEVLAKESEFDLQQFFLIPWRWDFFAQHRRESKSPHSGLAWLYRLYWALGMDVGLHLAVWPLAKLLPAFSTKIFFRHIVPLTVPRGWKVVDRSDRQLTMEHELFRHIEIELFVTRSRLQNALEFVTWFLKVLGRESAPPPDFVCSLTPELSHQLEVAAAGFTYTHHYPICIRHILPDDALISMSCDHNESSYAISLISYAWPSRRDEFFRMSELLTESMVKLFGARAHWGKYCPKDHTQMPALYSRWNQFAEIRNRLDPDGALSNDWASNLFNSADD